MLSNPLSPDGGNDLIQMWKYSTNELFGYLYWQLNVLHMFMDHAAANNEENITGLFYVSLIFRAEWHSEAILVSK